MNYSILLQTSTGFGLENFLLIGGILVVFYFFMIRPQQKKQKDQKRFTESIKRGDQVVTVGGIHGRVSAIEDNTVLLDVEKGAKIRLDKSSISLEASKKLTESSK